MSTSNFQADSLEFCFLSQFTFYTLSVPLPKPSLPRPLARAQMWEEGLSSNLIYPVYADIFEMLLAHLV